MLELIMLGNGSWIDPSGPVGIKVEYFDHNDPAGVDRHAVYIHAGGTLHRFDFTGRQRAEDFAGGVAKQVNRARKDERHPR